MPCAFLAQIYTLLPRLAGHFNETHSLPIGPRFIKLFFILADLTTVLTQLAGTALSITFGDLVKIGRIVSRPLIRTLPCCMVVLFLFSLFTMPWSGKSRRVGAVRGGHGANALAHHRWSLGPTDLFPLFRCDLYNFPPTDVSRSHEFCPYYQALIVAYMPSPPTNGEISRLHGHCSIASRFVAD